MRILPLLACVACASAPTVSGHPVDLPPRPGDALAQAVHLLDRLAYGPSPADLQAVASLGAAGWISQQLTPDQIDDSAVDGKLRNLATLRMSTAELEAKFVPLQRRERLASEMNRFEMPREVTAELTAARLIRAVESRRQLHEVLLDFWFNHFNVSADKGAVRWMISPYEREALRPHLFGSFRTLLGAVAHHPAMLFYLDNWTSTREGFEAKVGKLGLNENYARELLELHTLGVEGGYSQEDVREVARCFTGWGIDRPRQNGVYAFHPRAHDPGEKHVLGHLVDAGGEADGERVLDLLADHPATARFIARKLAQKFVSDDPPAALVERVAQRWTETHGDLRAVYLALFTSPELWAEAGGGTKTKTPLELAASSIRAFGGTTAGDQPLAQAIARMGEPLYRAQPPTGYPEIAQPWANAGALVVRINFGLALAGGRVPGTEVHVSLPPEARSPEQVVDRLAADVLHRPLSAASRSTLLQAAARAGPDILPDGERRPVNAAKLAGLLLGSPEFQHQ